MTPRGALALGALAAILLVTVAWWALALWPVAAAPAWLARTRAVCFGAAPGGLPDAAGWLLLIGEPIGMVGLLVAVWGRALGEGLTLAARRPLGRIALAGVGVGLLAGVSASARLVAEVRGEPFSVGPDRSLSETLAAARVDEAAPELELIDQHGDTVALDRLAGRLAIVTFAFAHCTTVCPVTVRAARSAARRLTEQGRPAELLVVTLDPWRDTPARLPSIAAEWKLEPGMHVLSGEQADVERVLTRWRVPRVRNPATGDITHPTMVYVVAGNGRLAYALDADDDAIVAAVAGLDGQRH
jgi:protein SCO1/2